MKWKLPKSNLVRSAIYGIILSLVLVAILAVFLGNLQTIYVVQSNAMLHDSSTDQVYYNWSETNLGYSREQINSWSVNNGFKIGDLLLNQKISCSNIQVGDVILYYPPSSSVPIAHRIIKINSDGTFMTKGDHNNGLIEYENSVACSQVQGKIAYMIPSLGYPMLLFHLPISLWLFIIFFVISYIVLLATKIVSKKPSKG